MKTRTALRLTVLALFLDAAAGFGQQPGLTLSKSPTCATAEPPVAPQPSVDSAAGRADSTGPSVSRTAGGPDVVLLVGFSADEIHFNSAPSASIRLCWGGDSLHVIERRNLPSPVVAGTTYRNVYIAAELRAYLNPECLARALGVSTTGVPAASASSCAALGLTTMSPSKPVSRAPNGSAH